MKAISKKRDAIIRATIELSAEKGINGATTVLIAERAKTAEVTIFRHFKTKEALLHTTFDEQIAIVRKILLTDHDKSMPFRERFVDYATKILQYFLEHSLELGFLEQYVHTPIGWGKRPDMLYQKGENFESYPLVQLLGEGHSQKLVKDLSMPALVGMVIGALAGFARECHIKGLQPDDKIIQDIVQACWDGIGA